MGRFGDDRIRCIDCRHFGTERARIKHPAPPPEKVREEWGTREVCRKRAGGGDPYIPQRCGEFERRAA